MDQEQPFWKVKTLEQMTSEEWESLCDGCARCCLHKLQDEETGEVFYTNVACRVLDLQTCRCMHYRKRHSLVPTCVQVTPELARQAAWLPETCAYRRLALGLDLPDWHPLITGTRRTVHASGVSLRGKVISEEDVDMDYLEEYIVDSPAE